MKFAVAILSLLSVTSADNIRGDERRRLSFDNIAGYAPGSQVGSFLVFLFVSAPTG